MAFDFENCQVRSDSTEAVRDALEGVLDLSAFLSDPENGWVSVYPHESISVTDLAQVLSARLDTAVFHLWNRDDQAEGYSLYELGTLSDDYSSDPEYRASAPDEQDEPMPPYSAEDQTHYFGKPERLLPYCVAGTTAEGIARVLEMVADGQSELYTELGKLLGVSDVRLSQDYRFMEQSGADFPVEKLETLSTAVRL